MKISLHRYSRGPSAGDISFKSLYLLDLKYF